MSHPFAIVTGLILAAGTMIVGFILSGEALLIFRSIVRKASDAKQTEVQGIGQAQKMRDENDTNPIGPRRDDVSNLRRQDTVKRMIDFFEK